MLETLLLTDHIPEIRWEHEDDLCDCTFQRIGWWTNPYLGRTLEIRLCCAWAKLAELHPEIREFMREIPAFDDYNANRWEPEPQPWQSKDSDMPRAIWYRQLVALTGKPITVIRAEYDHLNPPTRVQKRRGAL
jgi:hypothetical protein